MKPRIRLALLAVTLAFAACHPGACWFPRAFPPGEQTELASGSSVYPRAPVEVLYDDLGVPHLYATDEVDLNYAMGFVHGRDRLSQIIIRRAGAYGRAAELGGQDFLDLDRMLRLASWGLDEEVEAVSAEPEVFERLEAYAAGINDGAAEAGQPLEMQVAGLPFGYLPGYEFEPWTVRDTIAVNRIVSFLTSTGWREELARTRIRNRIPENDARLPELLEPMGTRDVPVVPFAENVGDDTTPAVPMMPTGQAQSAAPRAVRQEHGSAAARPHLPAHVRRLRDWLGGGGSNAWALEPSLTTSGNALLANDPHVTHDAPSFFYLVHMEAEGTSVAGATVPGLNGLALGHGPNVAWATVLNNADLYDLVRMVPYDGRDDLYLLDARPVAYETELQTFQIGLGDGAKTFEEVWRSTRFGPVLPPGYGHLVDEGETYSMMWIAFGRQAPLDGSDHRWVGALSPWELGRARDLDEAAAAVDLFETTAINVTMASTAGEIGLQVGGHVPVRETDAAVWLPRDGSLSSAGWIGRLPLAFKPQLKNPASGRVVAANQAIVELAGPRSTIVGREGNMPYRAQRVHELLDGLETQGAADIDDFLSMQQDVVSTAHRDLAAAMNVACPDEIEGIDEMFTRPACRLLREFEGSFDVDSAGAVILRRLERVLRRQILTAHLGEEVALQVQDVHEIRYNVHRRIIEEGQGTETALLDDPATGEREGLAGFMATAMAEVLEAGAADPALGQDPELWRWGAVHTLTLEGPLASLPLIGSAWTAGPTEEAGCETCIRAEAGTAGSIAPGGTGLGGEPAPLNPDRVRGGAGLRMVAEMSDPPVVRFILDSGQAGNFGQEHFRDQYPAWASGDPVQLMRARADIEGEAEAWLKIARE